MAFAGRCSSSPCGRSSTSKAPLRTRRSSPWPAEPARPRRPSHATPLAHRGRHPRRAYKQAFVGQIRAELNERIRDVVVGPDGALYVATDSPKGRVLRITPKT
ncbi:MAG: PQQ-dependent sugar dehydrogenase [Pseudomonadota bacterium]|uniref:PQQ-dependent sugar dehydrogenase n=1 Tax=Phenylobacterium sp. TaxID=1871053 RepID=UPI0025CFAFAC|nr:PQQ-dependent sugar dehydrogenase [Phenylobacterium sp.]